MRIVDKYVIKSFLVPFFATFFVVMFVLVMQFLWFAFDNIAGKGIDFSYILKFLGYTALQVAPTALPIGVLLSSIMAMGNLSENYEMAALKSAGISLKRVMRPLIFITLIISAINFLFLNNIYPYASLKQRNLYFNMKKQKPALALVEGSFNTDIPGYSIYFEKKYGPEKNLLKNVRIYDLKGSKKNDICITAERGEIKTQEGSKYMTLHLYDGYYYEDHTEGKKLQKNREKMPASSAKFESYKVNIDISAFNENNLDLEKYKTHYMMLNIRQLKTQSDSLKSSYNSYLDNKALNFYKRNNGKELFQRIKDSDKGYNGKKTNKNILENFNLNSKISITQTALSNVKTPLKRIKTFKNSYKTKRKILNLYDFEYHYRWAFSLSCLMLFFIGAPLGSLIRKGGFGTPMVFAVLIFISYFFINSFSKNIAEESSISSTLGGWLATIILFPFGLILTMRATKGTRLMNLHKYTILVNTIVNRIKPKTKT